MQNKGELTPGNLRRTPILPSDLEGSLRHLDEATFAHLLAGVLQEASRRGSIVPKPVVDKAAAISKIETSASRKGDPASPELSTSLRQGQLNAIRAAFKAGIKIPAIARQFGIPQSTVKQVIASRH